MHRAPGSRPDVGTATAPAAFAGQPPGRSESYRDGRVQASAHDLE